MGKKLKREPIKVSSIRAVAVPRDLLRQVCEYIGSVPTLDYDGRDRFFDALGIVYLLEQLLVSTARGSEGHSGATESTGSASGGAAVRPANSQEAAQSAE